MADTAQPVARVVAMEGTPSVRLEWASVEAAHNARPGPLYAVADGPQPVARICGACGKPWDGAKCGQALNGWPHPVCYAADALQPASAAKPVTVQVWCDTCEGTGQAHQESQAGVPGSGGTFDCPDCGGNGFVRRAYFTEAPKVKPLTDEAVTAAARALCGLHAEVCLVDADDCWALYGDDFKRSARAALQAAIGIGGDHG